ncbi:SAF domain-containing protein [Nocardioides pantholopis]|uniref:SAF domain-containing protein n=1 Tax=Nocardioides pantholopis TaxID=2483798 RepID=UPI001F49CC65|nr:SAF domain-containing protein [Nocardioides pantholopis]
MLPDVPDLPVLPDRHVSRLRRAARGVRRAVLSRRRLLAAVLAAVAVAAGLQAAAGPPPATEPVLVAARDLDPGRPLAAGDLVEARFAAGTAPAGLAGDPVGRVLAAPLRRGEPVTDVRLVGPELAAGHPGRVAVPVRLPDPAMAGLLRVGDVVDLVAADPQGDEPEVVARDVPVLAVPDVVADAAGDGAPGRLVVVGALDADVPGLADAAVRRYLTYSYSR